jgi:hypothetical protein
MISSGTGLIVGELLSAYHLFNGKIDEFLVSGQNKF